MRTKNLNLKKKIAFIASVAMIATTASYLPAGSFTADAAVPVETSIYAKQQTEPAAADGTVQNVNVYVKIDGKYLTAHGEDLTDATVSKKYKLKNTLDLNPSDGYNVIELSSIFSAHDADADPFHDAGNWIDTDANGAADADYTTSDNYDVLKTAGIVELPYFANASTVTFEFAAREKASLTTRSVKSIDIDLNDHGVGKLGKQSEYVTAKSLTSTYDEIKETFKTNADGTPKAPAGSYEVFDLSGLEVCMTAANNADDSETAESFKVTDTAIASIDNETAHGNALVAGNLEISTATTGYCQAFNTTYTDPDEYDADTFSVMKVGGVFARVIKGQLTKAVAPNTVIKLKTGAYETWTASGSGVASGNVTVSMDENGYGVSNLVTMTKGSEKEYYVYVLKNADSAIAADPTLIDQFTFAASGDANAAGNKTIFGKSAAPQNASAAKKLNTNGATDTTDRWKVESEVVTEKVNGANKYVTKYTIFNSETKDDYAGLDDAAKWIKIDFQSSNTTANQQMYAMIADGVKTKANLAAGQEETVSNTKIKSFVQPAVNTAGNITSEIYIKRTSAGTASSEVIALNIWDATANAGTGAYVPEYVEFEFTNQYEIKCDNNDDNNRTDLTKDYDSKASVTGQKINNPGTIDKKGFKFTGWKANNGATTEVFNVDNGSEQMNEEVVNPNIKLDAQYKGYRYDIKLDGNGGYITNINNGSGSNFDYVAGTNQKMPLTANYVSKERDTTGADNDITNFKGANAVKTGFEFLGWSTNANATKGMTVKEIADAFPGEEKTLNLYAVYEAKKEISVELKMIGVEDNGEPKETDGKKSKVLGVYTAADAAQFEKASDASITFTAGEKLGKLPTPYFKGYDFDGWYTKTYNSTRTSITATEVTEDTVLDASFFENQADDQYNNDGDLVVLYAKFTQKNYNITFDIGDGVWESAEVTKKDGRLPATMSYNGSANVAEANRFGFRRPDNTVVLANTNGDELGWTDVANPTVGSGEMTDFKCWRINDSKQAYADLKAVYTGLTKLSNLGDVTITAEYEDKENTTASKIFLNANEGAFYTYKLSEVDTTTKKPTRFISNSQFEAYKVAVKIGDNYYEEDGQTQILFAGNAVTYVNGNKKYFKTAAAKNAALVAAGLESFQSTGLDLADGTAGIKVEKKWIINGDQIETTKSGDTAYGYEIARPGYEFTGWYLDKECTKPYTFDVYPAKGTETILFAGWKASGSVRYWLNYDLFNGDKSEASDAAYSKDAVQAAGNNITGSKLKYIRTFLGTMGSTVSAKDLTVNVKDGQGTQAAYTKYVFDPELSKTLDYTSNEVDFDYNVASLLTGDLEQKTPYVFVYGRFIEDGYQSTEPETPSKELGTATDVKVAADGTVTFKPAANAKKYQVAKIVGSKTYYTAKFEDVTSIKVSPTKADYKVYVIAFNEDGTQSTHSVVVTGKGTGSQVALGTVMDPVATEKLEADGTKTVTISWSKAENAAWYKVFKIVNGKKYWGSKVTDTSYVLKNIPATDSYIVYVAAGDGKGHVTYGARKKVSKFPSVTNVTVAPDNKTVTFDAVEGAVAYQVAKIESNNKVNYSAKSTNPSITLKNAFKAGQKYYVLAFFTDADGKTKSSYSDTFEIK